MTTSILSFQTRWAVCEDLMFSYPLRHDYRLLAAHDVKCFHNETYASMSFKKAIFYGRSSAIMRYHFICQHDDLKTWAYIWMTFGVLLGHFIKGLMFSPRHLGLFVGGISRFQAIFASATMETVPFLFELTKIDAEAYAKMALGDDNTIMSFSIFNFENTHSFTAKPC